MQKNSGKTFLWILVSIVVIFIAGWFLVSKISSPKSEIIARNGFHWHAELNIKILGQVQEIPADIGLGAVENPIHTHDTDNVIHMEFSGLVTKNDLKISRFFKLWQKRFDKDCILDKCSGQDGQVKMMVNGEPNSEFENYSMKDGDKIEIIFEAPPSQTPTEEIKNIEVLGTEFSFSPSTITVKAGQKIKLTFKNEGRAPHNLVIEGLGISTKTIGGGKTDIIEFTAPASGSYAIFCSVPGHRASGMEGSLKAE